MSDQTKCPFIPGKKYKMRRGGPILTFIGINPNAERSSQTVFTYEDGILITRSLAGECTLARDDILPEEVGEFKLEKWANVYPNDYIQWFDSKEAADRDAELGVRMLGIGGRIACVYVSGIEGVEP